MTLTAERNGNLITLRTGYGPARFEVSVPADTAAGFWHQLGTVLADREKQAPALTLELPGEPQDAYQSLGREDAGPETA